MRQAAAGVAAMMAMAAMFVLLVVSSIVTKQVRRRLREKYPEEWRALGEPSFFWNHSIRGDFRWECYLWSPRPLDLGDPLLTEGVKTLRTLNVLGATFLLLAAISLAVGR